MGFSFSNTVAYVKLESNNLIYALNVSNYSAVPVYY